MHELHMHAYFFFPFIQLWTQMSVDSMYGCLTVSYDKMSSMFFLYGVINYVAR